MVQLGAPQHYYLPHFSYFVLLKHPHPLHRQRISSNWALENTAIPRIEATLHSKLHVLSHVLSGTGCIKSVKSKLFEHPVA